MSVVIALLVLVLIAILLSNLGYPPSGMPGLIIFIVCALLIFGGGTYWRAW